MTKRFLIDPRNFQILKRINSGGFGFVYSVQNKQTDEVYAAKIINSTGSQNKKMINREISIMMRMQHPTIIKFYGYSLTDFDGNANVTILMQYAKNGTLADHLKKAQLGLADGRYDNTVRQKILIGIARGMMYLHQHHAIHRDLKPENILIDDDFEPHIADFGLSKYYYTDQENNNAQSIGTPIYVAPEIIEKGEYNYKADVYSFGILMYEVVTDSYPYPQFQKGKMTLFQLNMKIINDNYRPTFEIPIKKSIKKLIEKCWSKDPKNRPSFEEIFNRLAFNLEESVDDVFHTDDEEGKFFLENVDTDEILYYVDKIENGQDSEKVSIDEMKKKIDNLTIKNAELSEENITLKKKIDTIDKLFKKLSDDNEQMKKQISEMQSKIVLLDENQKNSNSTEKVTNNLTTRRNSSINFVKSSEIQNLSMKKSTKSSDAIQPSNTQNASLKEHSQLSNANTQNAFPISHLMSFNAIHPPSPQNASIKPQSLQSFNVNKPQITQNAFAKPQHFQNDSPVLIKNSTNPPSSGPIKCQIVIQNMRCINILALDNEMPYPYLIFTVNKSALTKRMTSVIPNCLNPVWSEKLMISVNDWNNDVLSVNLFTDDGLYNAKLMNELNIPVNTWPIGNRINFVENIKLGNEKAGVLYMTIDVLEFN